MTSALRGGVQKSRILRTSFMDHHGSNYINGKIVQTSPLTQFAVWIGPAQQYIINSDCSVLWPQLEDIDYVKCIGAERSLYENITLRNITISDPLFRFYIYVTGCICCNDN